MLRSSANFLDRSLVSSPSGIVRKESIGNTRSHIVVDAGINPLFSSTHVEEQEGGLLLGKVEAAGREGEISCQAPFRIRLRLEILCSFAIQASSSSPHHNTTQQHHERRVFADTKTEDRVIPLSLDYSSHRRFPNNS